MAVKGSVEITLSLKQQKQVLSAYRKVEKQLKKNNDSISDGFKKVGIETRKTEASTKKYSSTLDGQVKKLAKYAISFIGVASAISIVTRSKEFLTRSAIDFEKTMSNVNAIVTSNQKELSKLNKVAKQLGDSTAFSASEVGQAFVELGKLGFKTEQILKSTSDVLNLAAASSATLEQSAKVTAQTLNQFALDASQAKNVTDLMAKSFTTSALDIEKFQESMKYVGTTARLIGLDITETTAMLAVLADNSIEASMAGTSLNQAMIQMSDPTSKVSKIFKEAGIESASFIEKLEFLRLKNIDVGEAFGLLDVRAARALNILLDQKDKVDSLSLSYRDLNDDAKMMAKTMLDNVAGATKILESSSEGLGIAIGEAFGDAKIERIKLYTDLIRGATSTVREHSEGLKSIPNLFNGIIKSITRITGLSGKGPLSPEVMDEGLKIAKEYIKVFENADVGMFKQGEKSIDLSSKLKLEELKKVYADINKEMASIYPIEDAKEWLELSDRIDKNLKQFTPTGGTKKYPGGLSKPELKKTSLAEEKKKEIKSLRPDLTEEVRQRTELDFEIRQLVLEAQEETEKQKIDLVKLQYEKERNVILNQEAVNIDLRKALKNKELSEIAEIEKQYLAEKDKENEKNKRREERRIEDLDRLKRDELNNAVSNLRVFASENKAFSEIYKAAAISRTIISTYEGAQNSFTSLSSIPVFGTVLGATAAAAAVAGGLARVQQIQAQKFADGGIVPGNGNTDSVPSMLTPGEMVLNREQQQRLLEGGTGTRIETVHIHVNGSGSPQETAATIEETLHNIKDQSMRMSTI